MVWRTRGAMAGSALLLAAGLANPALLWGQELEDDFVSFSLELRVELRDYFAGPLAEGDPGRWHAEYVEGGDVTLELRDEGLDVRVGGSYRMEDLAARAAPILVDGCGNQWVRHWEDPAQVEWESEFSAEVVDDGPLIAVWYRPAAVSLVDPGGRRARRGCAGSDEEDPPRRRTLAFDPSDLGATTESGLPAVRADGSVLIAIVPWARLASGDPISHGVRYGDSRVGFRARLELVPTF
jgi:hypothetical protein